MVYYEVVQEPEAGLAEPLERYMRAKHIPEILATGCFREIAFQRDADGRFRSRYGAATQADLDRYLAEHTAAFRADFLAHFPQGVTLERRIWTDVEVWQR